jgi:hypothetical protein
MTGFRRLPDLAARSFGAPGIVAGVVVDTAFFRLPAAGGGGG